MTRAVAILSCVVVMEAAASAAPEVLCDRLVPCFFGVAGPYAVVATARPGRGSPVFPSRYR